MEGGWRYNSRETGDGRRVILGSRLGFVVYKIRYDQPLPLGPVPLRVKAQPDSYSFQVILRGRSFCAGSTRDSISNTCLERKACASKAIPRSMMTSPLGLYDRHPQLQIVPLRSVSSSSPLDSRIYPWTSSGSPISTRILANQKEGIYLHRGAL